MVCKYNAEHKPTGALRVPIFNNHRLQQSDAQTVTVTVSSLSQHKSNAED